ncbi:hypothetical protein BGZ67_002106 [Mortierella alpina]|nr:hypothetical protein BGZ67_002106 [Mortierella alpina]
MDLVDSEIDDAALAAIALSCPKLKSLDLSRNEMISFREFLSPASLDATNDMQTESRAQANGPSAINLNYCNKITARGIQVLVEGCPQLHELEFLSCDLVSAECFRGQRPWACTKLRRLEFTFHPRVLFTRSQQDEEEEVQAEHERGSDGEHEEGENAEVHGQEYAESGDISSQATHPDQLQLLQSKTLSTELPQPEEQQQDQMDTSYLYNVHQQLLLLQQQQQQQQQLPQQEPQGNDQQEHCNASIMRTINKQDLWSYEQESVQSDYHAMFKQLKRLKALRSLHIYNSPALNSSANPGDPYQEGAAAPWMPDGAFFIGGPPVDTTSAQASDALEEETLTDGASTNSPSFLGFQGAEEGTSSIGVHRGEEADESQDMYPQEESSSDNEEQANGSGSSSSNLSSNLNSSSSSNQEGTSLLSVRPRLLQGSSTATATVAAVASPVHPFSLRIGLKALERLTQLESLTLYERSNIPFGSAEARWISRAFPQLSLLQLRGAIEISDTVLGRLTAKRPDLKVQVCSLFE